MNLTLSTKNNILADQLLNAYYANCNKYKVDFVITKNKWPWSRFKYILTLHNVHSEDAAKLIMKFSWMYGFKVKTTAVDMHF